MNKRKIIILLIIVIIIFSTIVAINNIEVNKFKKEYESLNGKTSEDGKKYIDVKIPADNSIIYADYKQIFKLLDSTGVIYFGFPECPWCRNAVPILIEAANETGIEKIYYMNNLKDRDIKVLKNDNIITKKEGTNNYKKLLEKLSDKASIYEGLNDNSIKRLYFPTVIAVKNGEIVDLISGTVDSQTDPYVVLSKSQKKELKDKYISAINKTVMCSGSEYKC